MFIPMAWAQAASGAQPSMLEQFFPFIIIIAIFYFLVIRPAQRRNKDQQAFLGRLKRGDSVLTSGGIMGTIEGLTDRFVVLEIAEGVRVRVLKSNIAAPASDELVKK